MIILEERYPAHIYGKFQQVRFMGQKSKRALSNIIRDPIGWLKNHAGVIENLDIPSTDQR